MLYTIYRITNKIDGKVYIGKHQTEDLSDQYFGSGKHLRRAISKYGIENFIKEILHVFDNEQEMNDKERELVTEEFCNRKDTYNICPGGNGGFGYLNSTGLNKSEKQKQIARENLSKVTHLSRTEESKLKISETHKKRGTVPPSWIGKNHSKEAKLKIGKANSISQLGKRNSQYGSRWITNGIENRKIKAVDIVPEGWYYGYKWKVN